MIDAPAPAANDFATNANLSHGLRTLGAQRVLILALVVFGALAALAFSLVQGTTYQAQASVAFTDQSRDLGIVGNVPVASQSPDQIAAAGVSTITRPAVLQLAARTLGGSLSPDRLRAAFSAQVDPRSSLVIITASAPSAVSAAGIANALATAVVRRTVSDARTGYALAARKVRAQLAGLNSRPDAPERTALAEELSRLVSLSVLAQPAQVAAAARVPSSPSSPKPVRNTILGAGFGLIVGLLAAMLRNSVDRRLRDPDEVRSHMDLPLLTQVGQSDLGSVPYLSSDDGDGDDGRAMEAFNILRTNLAFLSDEGSLRTIAVTSAIAEEGKSTVAISLACASAAAGRLTLLIDCDLRRPRVAERLNLARAPGVTDYLGGLASPEEVLQTVTLSGFNTPGWNGHSSGTATGGCQLTCITAGSPHPHPAELLSPGGPLSAFLVEVAQMYEMVVIDTSPLLPVADTRELLPFVDGILLCVRANLTSREQALAGKAALAKLPARPTGLVVTGVKDRDSYYGYYAE